MFQGQVAEEQIGEVRTVKSLGHEDHAKELYLSATAATYKTRVLLALVTAPLEGTCSGRFLCQLAPTLLRPFLAHFCSFFPRCFAVLSILPPRFRKPAPRPGKTVRNGRKTAGKNPKLT